MKAGLKNCLTNTVNSNNMELYRKCMSFVQRTYSKAVLDGWNVNQFSFGHSRAYLKGWYYDDTALLTVACEQRPW